VAGAPDLIEVKSTGLGQGKSARKVVEFNLNVNIKRPRDKDKPDGGKKRQGCAPRRGATMAKANLDLNLGAQFADQFRDLNGRHPGQWPLAPRVLCASA
jgi:hypothetical protein